MSAQDDKSKKELTDKELKQATGGADIDSGGGVGATTPGIIREAGGWYDPQGDWHPGPNPNAATESSDPVITINEEGFVE